MIKNFARACATGLATIPGVTMLTTRFATAPVRFKTAWPYKAIAALASRVTAPRTLIETNFGIATEIRALVPSDKHYLLYGRPDHIEHERGTLDLARIFARHSRAFVDVGANEGLFVFSVASEIGLSQGARIHAFEPDIDLYNRLKLNLSRNMIGAKLNQIAVCDRIGRQTFHRNLNNDLSGSLAKYFTESHETIAVEIDTTTLSNYLVANDLTDVCLKIDVEGAGSLAWAGTEGARDRISWLLIEIIGPEVAENLPRRILEETGWSAYYIRDYELVPSIAGEFDYRAPFYNWLFCPADRNQLTKLLTGSKFRVLEPASSKEAR